MTDAMDEALVTAHRELIRAELAYCRAAAQYAGFLARHTRRPESDVWVTTYNNIVTQYTTARERAIDIGLPPGKPMRRMDDDK